MPIPDRINTPTKFETETSVKKASQGRGSELQLVDLTYANYYQAVQALAGNDVKIKRLRALICACAYWRKVKAKKLSGKNTGSAYTRNYWIVRLRDGALDELTALSPAEGAFARKKVNAIEGGAVEVGDKASASGFTRKRTAGLTDAYAYERSIYEATFKGTANDGYTASASQVHEAIEHRDRLNGAAEVLGKKDRLADGKIWEKLSEQEFIDIYTLMNADDNFEDDNTVLFFNKSTRMQYMRLYQGGQITNVDGTPYSSHQSETMWAMDIYGNLFCNGVGQTGYDRMNHSSLCAGKPVICAGTLVVANGTLTQITSASGHYKPTRRQLIQACEILRDDGGIPFPAGTVQAFENGGLVPVPFH